MVRVLNKDRARMKHSLTSVIAACTASLALLFLITPAVAQPQVGVAINIGAPVLSSPVVYSAPQVVYVEQKIKYKKIKKDKHGKHHGHDHDGD